MNGFEFDAYYGDLVKKVEVSLPSGGGDFWHIYIDRYYYGRIANVDDEWKNLDARLEKDDIDAIIERIQEYLRHKKSLV
jgi:hypothetical protein